MSMLKLIAGAGGATINTAWDLSYASFDGTPVNFYYLSGQPVSSPTGVFFKSDGTKMYTTGDGFSTDAVFEYSLSTAWDISTTSYSQNFSVGTQDTEPRGVFFKSDGTKMYVAGGNGIDINEYSLSTAWNISTASYSQNFSVATQDTQPYGLFFKPDGTKMYFTGQGEESGAENVVEYSLSTAWDISTASYSQNFSVATQETSPTGVFFKDDGTKMYVIGRFGDDINEYSLSTAWDISTASYSQNFSVSSESSTPYGLFFKDNGTKMYIVDATNRKAFEYDLSTAWNISTASFTYPTTDYFSVSTQETSPSALSFKSDGTKMYVLGAAGRDVNEYSLSTAWDISTASYVRVFSVSTQDTAPTGLFFKPDGTKMYVLGNAGDDVNEYSLSTAWNISTASYVRVFSVSTEETNPTGLFFKPDGTKMYVIGTTGDDVNEYSLSTAWDISTASYVRVFSVATQETVPSDLFFKDDGTKMYVIGQSGRDVNEYSLSTAWDISTASYVQNFFIPEADNPAGVFFKDDGTKMYALGTNGVWAYTLSL